jgi:membrane protein DedA with SNARE-associated domain
MTGPPSPPAPSSPPRRKAKFVRILALLLVLAVSVTIFVLRDQIDVGKLKAYRYVGIFAISFLAYATVLLPAPGAAFVFTLGAAFSNVPFNTVRVALAAGTGAALGEITGYLAGFGSQAAIEKTRTYQRLSGWMHKHGAVTVFLLAALPNPLFDLAGMVAGAGKMPVWKFLFWCWAGETIKMLVIAASGAAGLNLFDWLIGH